MPNFDLKNKAIAITGGSGGIGLATSLLLLSQGAKVSVADISETTMTAAKPKLEEAAKRGNGEYMTALVDVRHTEQVDRWIKETVATFGKLDGAVNLHGVIPKSININRVEDLQDDEWQFVIDINLNGVMRCMRAQIRNMNDKGSIINASSIAGIRGFPKNSAYTAAKHGVIGLTRSAAKEVGPDRGIRVNAISPGVIDTPMYRESVRIRGGEGDHLSNMQIKRKAEAEEVADLCAWLLCDASSYITGTVQVIDGGYTC